MTHHPHRSFPFKYSQNHSRTGDVIVVGDPNSHTDHLVIPARNESDTTRAQAKKALAVAEATQARAAADTYQDALSLAEQPGNAKSVTRIALHNLEKIRAQADQLEAEAVYPHRHTTPGILRPHARRPRRHTPWPTPRP